MIHARAGAVVLALALLVASAKADGELGDWCAEAGFALELPPGWAVEREVAGHGATLRAPAAERPLVEIVTWRVSVGVVRAEDAAAEHERVLGWRLRYERSESEPISTTGAGDGVYVEGTVELPDGSQAAALFAAFLGRSRAYVIGGFADMATTAVVRKECIEPVVQGLCLLPSEALAGPGVEPRPLPPREPGEGREQPIVRPPQTGVTPANADDTPGTGEGAGGPNAEPVAGRHEDPAGFSLDLPRGWQCQAHGTLVWASSPDGAAAWFVPVRCIGGEAGSAAVEEAVGRGLSEMGSARLVACRRCGRDREGVWFWLRVNVDGRTVSGPSAMVQDGSNGLIAGVLSAGDPPDQSLRECAKVVASFSARVDGSEVARPAESGTPWTDSSGRLECAPPQNWRLEGGVSTYDGAPVVNIGGTRTAGPRAWFAWRQPIRPIFRDLTPAMRGLGFRDGDPYYAYDGADRRMVMTRGGPADLVQRYLLPQNLVPGKSLEILGEEEAPEALGILEPGEEISAIVSLTHAAGTRPEQAWCIVSQRTTQPSRGGWFWEAACLCFGGTWGEGLGAGRALQATIRSARTTGNGGAQADAQVQALLDRASAACRAPLWRELMGDAVVVPVLGEGVAAATAEATYVAPEAATRLWTDVAEGGALPCIEVVTTTTQDEVGQ